MTDASPPALSVTLTISGTATGEFYVLGSTTQNGVSLIAPGRSAPGSTEIQVVLKTPYTLAPGTYADTIALQVCTDSTCARQVQGSPISVSVRYVVTAVTGAEAPALVVVPKTDFFTQALPTDSIRPADANAGVTIRNVPAFPIYVSVTLTNHGIESAELPSYFHPGSPGDLGSAPLPIRYRVPNQLSPGMYRDTVTVTACLDSACVNPLAGSPAVITTTYQVGNDLPGPDGYTVSTVPLQANDMVWDPAHTMMYVATAAGSSQHPNSLVSLDPSTGSITGSVDLGAEPSLLAISNDDQYLYVAIKDSPSIRRFQLPALTLDATLDIGTDPLAYTLTTLDMQVSPWNSSTIAVSRKIAGVSPQPRGVVIIDGVTRRPSIAGADPMVYSPIVYLQWGADAATLYGTDVVSSLMSFTTMAVDASGVTITGISVQEPGGRMQALDGLLYFDSGSVFDPVTLSAVGTLIGNSWETSHAVGLDSGNSRIYHLTDNGGGIYNFISIYDLRSLAPLKRFTVIGPTLSSTPFAMTTRLVRWGTNGLAYPADDGTIVIIRGAYLIS